jgi:NAD(P)-dependent dehydrogenase (short-subunit alcohol dehydrogenase family)
LAARDVEKAGAARDRILAAVPGAELEIRELDLADLASVRAFAEQFLADHERLDVLIDNAGVMACPQGTTADGIELQFGTNHVGHFLLTTLLAPVLVKSAPSRVVVLSSAGHRRSDVDLEDYNFEKTPYDPWLAYGRSKTANALFALGFNQRYAGAGVQAWSVHPGGIRTELGRHLTPETMAALQSRMGEGFRFKTIPQGAATSVWAATAPMLVEHGGAYLEDCSVAVANDDPEGRSGVRAYAQAPQRADDLCALSERLVVAKP